MSKPKVVKKKPKAAKSEPKVTKKPMAAKSKSKVTKKPKAAKSKPKAAESKPIVQIGKPKVIKDYDKLPTEIVTQVKLFYPNGYEKKLILFKNHKKKLVSALPFEGAEYFYMVRMTKEQAQQIITNDEDFDHNGKLKLAFKEANATSTEKSESLEKDSK